MGEDNLPRQVSDDAKLASLTAAITDGDEAALSSLYDLTVARVYNLAQAMTGSAVDAEEVVCDVYLQVWRRSAQYDPKRGPVIAWLIVLCRSLALDLLRRRRSYQARQQRLAEQEAVLTTQAPTADVLVNLLQEGSAVHRALSELSDIQQRMIALAFFQNMSHSEIAAEVELPLGTVKSHINRGLRRLRSTITL